MSPPIEPLDDHNLRLLDHVHPPDWVNPTPARRYNLVVLGAGTAGLVTAAGAAGLGARVALVERHLMGGDCLNVGCVPSKTLIAAARESHAGGRPADFAAVMERVRRTRAAIAPHDSAARFRDLGVDVFLGEGRFVDFETIAVGESRLRFRKAVIATGARATHPDIPGLAAAGCLTNETVFNLTRLPRRLAVIGAGPIGCELAQAFQRLGSEVTLFHSGSHVMSREDPEAAAVVQGQFERDGIRLLLRSKIDRVREGHSSKELSCTHDGGSHAVEVDEILVGVGRAPNVEGLGLDAASVDFHPREGVIVDDFLRTSNHRVFAAGDVCLRRKFTHAADFAARLVIQNALFLGRKKFSRLNIPRCTYTDPELAQTGLSVADAREVDMPVDVWTRPWSEVDRARTEGDSDGFVRILTRRNTDTIVGATIVGAHAGELISEISVAMAAKLGLRALANVIHPYPTRAEAIRQLGDACNRTRLTPFLKRAFSTWLNWTL